MPQTILERLGTVCMAVGVLSSVATAYCVAALGGDALGGMVQGNHYFLGYKGHLTEVSKRIYTASLSDERLRMVVWPVGMLLLLATSLRRSDHKRPV